MEIKDYCNGKYYILCICEGNAEEDIITWLLEEDRLIFSNENLIEKKITRVRPAKRIEDKFLSLDYDKPLVIFRIIDSKNEKFKLSNLYKDRYQVQNLITNPEIEILLIIKEGELGKYMNKFSKQKPSKYAQKNYKIKDIKHKDTIKSFFNGDIDSLIESIIEHKNKKAKDHITIYDILKKTSE